MSRRQRLIHLLAWALLGPLAVATVLTAWLLRAPLPGESPDPIPLEAAP